MTSVLLGILSASVGFVMVLIVALALIYLVIPIHIVVTQWEAGMIIVGIIFFFKVFSIVIISMLILPIIVYILGIPQYFNYLDDTHIRPLLGLHKYFNLAISFVILFWIFRHINQGMSTTSYQVITLAVIFGVTFLIGFFTKAKRKTYDR